MYSIVPIFWALNPLNPHKPLRISPYKYSLRASPGVLPVILMYSSPIRMGESRTAKTYHGMLSSTFTSSISKTQGYCLGKACNFDEFGEPLDMLKKGSSLPSPGSQSWWIGECELRTTWDSEHRATKAFPKQFGQS